MMMKFIERQKGAISIFLTLILLPMMTVASIYIDASRVRLANTLMSSAGDLTLNTALSNYDNILKDMYGLFAVSQSKKELMENLEDYYTKMVLSAGLSEEESKTYVGQIMKQLDMVSEESEVSDLLRIQQVPSDKDFIEVNPSVSLANPGILKKQIVEFMKYRFAIGFGMDFLESLKSFKGIKEQKAITDNSQKYYKKQEDTVITMEKIWDQLESYQLLEAAKEPFYDKLKEELTTLVERYKPITANAVQDSYNSDSGNLFTCHIYADTKGTDPNDTIQLYEDRVLVNASTTYEEGKYPTLSDVSSMATSLYDAQKKYSNDIKANNTLRKQLFSSGGYQKYYDIQFIIQFNKECKSGVDINQTIKDYYIKYHQYKDALDSVVKAKEYYDLRETQLQTEMDGYDTQISANSSSKTSNNSSIDSLEAEKSNTKKPPTPKRVEEINDAIDDFEDANDTLDEDNKKLAKKKKEAEAEKVTVEAEQVKITEILDANFLYPDTGTPVKYMDLISKQYKKLYQDDFLVISQGTKYLLEIVDKVNQDKDFKKTDGTTVLQTNKEWVQGTVSDERIKEINTYFTDIATKLGVASEALGAISKNLNTLLTAADDLNATREVWYESTNVPNAIDTSLAKQNREEIKINEEFIKREEVQVLLTRVDNSKVAIDNLISKINEYTYFGDPIVAIADYKSFLSKLGEKANQVIPTLDTPPLDSDALKDYYINKIYANCKEPTGGFESVYLWETASGTSKPWKDDCHPILDDNDRKIDAVECNFYQYLRDNFKSKTSVSEAKEEDSVSDEVESNLNKRGTDTYNEEKSEAMGAVEAVHTMTEFEGNAEFPLQKWKEIKKLSGSGGPATSDGFFDGMASLFDGMADQEGGLLTYFRDNIYITDYMLSMFTYKTYEKELYWEIKEEEAKANNTTYEPPNVFKASVNPVYTSKDSKYSLNSEYQPGSDEKALGNQYFLKAKSLTNVPMTPDYHYAYLNEVEYIIYGDEGKGVNNTIFGIRLAFNSIYAFTNSEIRDGAYTIAFAVFGTPPLTFLVPVAKVAIIIAVAFAESCLDMKMLNEGLAVPLYKSKETWILSFSGLTQQMMNAAEDAVIDVANKAVDSATNKLGEWVSAADEKIQGVIDNVEGSAKDLMEDVNAAIDEEITRCTDAVMNQVVELCNAAVIKTDKDGKINGLSPSEYVLQQVNEWIKNESNATIDDEVQQAVFQALMKTNVINEDIVGRVLADVEEVKETGQQRTQAYIESISESMRESISQIRADVSALVTKSAGAIKDYKDAAFKKINDGIAGGSDKLKKSISDVVSGQVTKILPEGKSITTSGKQSTSHASFFSFHYSDYLRLFLLIGMTINQEELLLRTADVMQQNMRHATGENYLFSEAYAYVTLHAKAKVPPLVMTLPWMTNMTSPYLGGSEDWYTITYDNTVGY